MVENLYQNTVLGKVAIRILSVPSTSASVDRSVSTFSFVHDKKRHKLKTNRAGRLCYIAHNWKVMHRRKAPGINESTKITTGNNTETTSQQQQAKIQSLQSSPRTLEYASIMRTVDNDNTSTTSPSSCSYTSGSESKAGSEI
ncbi:unnamed protein product [Acanthoscelides obtectus]|uniref:HAT C-terminal dimerisation domain-containing protein n=1 Tax=Acanthoscelides obtectus TaxID=200917 RepID=A0A9P0KNE5_ACAOB|nr:unnamed protein product [Acanthoscelides obtectus]CAK1631375.1 hypothetical protein AOBTE_LOCUS6915 [Acanthoscelides obtectus]